MTASFGRIRAKSPAGDQTTVLTSGNSVKGKVVSEIEADDLENHFIDWIA